MEALQQAVTGRSTSLFAHDLESHREAIASLVEGRHVLVAGAAGSIGRATILALIPFRPAHITLVDVNENGLTELVRDLRYTFADADLPMLSPRLLDITSPHVVELADQTRPPDVVMNFAAVKHVRSERDRFSLSRMFEVNVLGMRNLVYLAERSQSLRLFSVSTDKAARPSSLMGASKAVMEGVLLQGGTPVATSARFANVAFSEGSLLRSWIDRLGRREPLPCPRDTRRYFVSLQEAGQLCVLAALFPTKDQVLIPRTGSDFRPMDLLECANRVVAALGATAIVVKDPTELRDERGIWRGTTGTVPILLSARDTQGEKEVEEFIGPDTTVADVGLAQLEAICAPEPDPKALSDFTNWLEGFTAWDATAPEKAEYVSRLRTLLPDFAWMDADKVLDDRL